MDKVRDNINGFSFATSPCPCKGLIISWCLWYSWLRMLKVAPCTVGRTVVRSYIQIFFGLMGYYYSVLLWGYAPRALLSVPSFLSNENLFWNLLLHLVFKIYLQTSQLFPHSLNINWCMFDCLMSPLGHRFREHYGHRGRFIQVRHSVLK